MLIDYKTLLVPCVVCAPFMLFTEVWPAVADAFVREFAQKVEFNAHVELKSALIVTPRRTGSASI